jgi:predicted RNA-binding Zn-ribbon protein involved in translation (DUF1610 family)
MSTGNYYLRCLNCDNKFYHTSDAKKYCPECDKEIKRERNRNFMRKKRRPSAEIKPLPEIMQELKEYNEKHGTCLSYGKYVAMIERGVMYE